MTNTLHIPSIMQIDASEIPSQIYHNCIRKKWVLLIHGAVGIGKSSVVSQTFAKYGATKKRGNFVDMRVSQWDAVDTRGIPDIDIANKLTQWNMPGVLPFIGNPRFAQFANDDDIIGLFLDEITAGSKAITAALYQLLNDGCLGEHVLMPNVCIVAATNRENDKGIVNPLPTPTKNRVISVEMGLSADAFCAKAIEEGFALGAAYISFRPQMLSTFEIWDEKSKRFIVTPDMAFSTPRSLFKIFETWDDDQMTLREKTISICGAVGVGVGNDFIGFANIKSSIIPIKKILADPKGCELPQEASLRHAVACNISGNMKTSNVDKLAVYLDRMDPEMTILAWKLALRRDDGLFETEAYEKYASQYADVFGAR